MLYSPFSKRNNFFSIHRKKPLPKMWICHASKSLLCVGIGNPKQIKEDEREKQFSGVGSWGSVPVPAPILARIQWIWWTHSFLVLLQYPFL
jgi:hypothetical protein